MNKVAYGGSFNPPTIAHYEIIKTLSKKYSEVIIVPNGNGYNRKNLNDFNLRIEMLKMLASEFTNVKISNLELTRKFNGTVETLRDLGHPVFACGDDCLVDLKTWIKADELVRENKFLIFTRCLNKDKIFEIIEKDELLNKYIDHFEVIKINFESVSSSEFRKTLNYDYLPSSIKDFIKQNNIYKKD